MLPVLKGLIRRRILLNFRAHPQDVKRLLPAPFEPAIEQGNAIVGICLIRLEQIRPKGMPAFAGVRSENMAHRVAVRYPTVSGWADGVYIWRRETTQLLPTLLGGRLFPGVHHRAQFAIRDAPKAIAMSVSTKHGDTDVHFEAEDCDWTLTPTFSNFREASRFFERGSCGFSSGLDNQKLEGMRLETFGWTLQPLAIRNLQTAFYSKRLIADFDSAFIMRNVEHEWHEIAAPPPAT